MEFAIFSNLTNYTSLICHEGILECIWIFIKDWLSKKKFDLAWIFWNFEETRISMVSLVCFVWWYKCLEIKSQLEYLHGEEESSKIEIYQYSPGGTTKVTEVTVDQLENAIMKNVTQSFLILWQQFQMFAFIYKKSWLCNFNYLHSSHIIPSDNQINWRQRKTSFFYVWKFQKQPYW